MAESRKIKGLIVYYSDESIEQVDLTESNIKHPNHWTHARAEYNPDKSVTNKIIHEIKWTEIK